MSWDSYVAMITNVYDAATQQYTVTAVGKDGAIFGLDGGVWAKSEGLTVTQYEHEIQLDETNVQKISVDEPEILKKLLGGDDRCGDGGVRIGGEKYMVTKRDGKLINLSKRGGGAIIGKAKTCGVIGIYEADKVDSTGKGQNPGDLTLRIEALVEYLESQGY